MKKNFLTSIILLAFMLLASCTPPEAPDNNKPDNPNTNQDVDGVSQVLSINRAYLPERTMAYQYYVENGESDWAYRWEIAGKTVDAETAIINMMELEWNTTYNLTVTAFSGKRVIGRGSIQVQREPTLVIKQNLANAVNGTFELKPILDIGTKVEADQKFTWTITDKDGKRLYPTPKDEDPSIMVIKSVNCPITVKCETDVAATDTHYERFIELNLKKEGILGNDTFISGQAVTTLGTNHTTPYSPIFTYYNVDWVDRHWSEEDADKPLYSDYRYTWKVGPDEDNMRLAKGDYCNLDNPKEKKDHAKCKSALISLTDDDENIKGNSKEMLISCTIENIKNSNESWTVWKTVTYIPFLEVEKHEMLDDGYQEVWFTIPFTQEGYDYKIVVGSPYVPLGQKREVDLPGTFGTTSYNMVSNIPRTMRQPDGKFYDEYYIRVRGTIGTAGASTVSSKEFHFKVNPDNRTFTWLP